LAQGYQPIGGPPSPLGFPGYNQGYPGQLLKLVRDRYEQLRLVKLGCGGGTTTTIVGAPWCEFPARSQLAEATAFLQAHRGEAAFVALDVGGNRCAATRWRWRRRDRGEPARDPRRAPRGGGTGEGIYRAASDPVADVEGAFASTDTTLVNGVPVNVLRVCEWTWLCAPPPHGSDIHPNSDSHGTIAHSFADALDA
jgi:hypothetical protein